MARPKDRGTTAHEGRARRVAVLVASVAALLASPSPTRAEPVPSSCTLHPTHVVNPGCVPAATSEIRDPGITLPNISPDVRSVHVVRPFLFDEASQTVVQGPPELQFDSWVQNLGTVPLELVADDPNNPTTALQCVSWTAHVCREKRTVGEYAWHEEHKHFHFQDFADYQLRRLGSDGRPDYSDAGLLARSEKVSFCLLDIALVDATKPAPPFYVTCGPTLQGVSPGWADVYSSGTPGQSLSVDGLPDGRYALIVDMDYGNRLYETDDTDNVVEVTVEVSGGLTEAVIVEKHRP
jgi:hypothetical protein